MSKFDETPLERTNKEEIVTSCTVTNWRTKESESYTNYVLVGLSQNRAKARIHVAADIADLGRAAQTLKEMFIEQLENAPDSVKEEVQQELEEYDKFR